MTKMTIKLECGQVASELVPHLRLCAAVGTGQRPSLTQAGTEHSITIQLNIFNIIYIYILYNRTQAGTEHSGVLNCQSPFFIQTFLILPPFFNLTF